MRSLTSLILTGTLTLGAIGISTTALATAYTISGEAAEDIGVSGGSGFQQRDLNNSTPPGVTSAFTVHLFASTSDPDKGCDGDAFANFSGLHQGATTVSTCGDTMIAQWAGGNVGVVSGGANLTATSFGNHDGIEFHVEDSAGTGNQSGSLTETLTIGNSATFSLPFNVDFGSGGDAFQIPAFDIQVCIKTSGNGNCSAQNGVIYDVISGGTGPTFLGSVSSDDDERAFETNLFGCVVLDADNTTANRTTCQSTLGTVSSFVADDPPLPNDVPEPASLAIFGSTLISLRLVRRRRA